MRNLFLVFSLSISLFISTVEAAVTPVAGCVDPVVSTAADQKWYLMMFSHLTENDRKNRFMYWDGTYLKTAQFLNGMSESDITPDYLWRLESAGDGNDRHVYLVNARDNKRIMVPSNATSENNSSNKSTPLVMDETGSVWEYALCSSVGLSNDCADKQYCFDYTGYTGSSNAFLNGCGADNTNTSRNYAVTVYETGVHQASGWFFYEVDYKAEFPTSGIVTVNKPENGSLTVKTENGDVVESGAEIDLNTKLVVEAVADEGYVLHSLFAGSEDIMNTKSFIVKGDVTVNALFISENNEFISENPFETMIRLNRISETPIYNMPGGSNKNIYFTSAMTTGDAVVYPLGYVRASDPGRYFVIVSKETTLLSKGADFSLMVNVSADPSSQVITFYEDWNRDGVYEKIDGDPVVNSSDKSFTKTISVPADAKSGKTRIRVRMDSTAPSSAESNVSGKVYDFVVYVMDRGVSNDCQITVSSNNEEYGTALIETESNESGRYDMGSDVTVKAVVNNVSGFIVKFDGWYDGENLVSKDEVYTFKVEKSLHLTAMFSATTGVCPGNNEMKAVSGQLRNGMVKLENLPEGCFIKVVSLSGQLLAGCNSDSSSKTIELGYEEQFVSVVIEAENGQTSILKLLNR